MAAPIIFSAAAARNTEPILSATLPRLPSPCARVLELASGGGQHASAFASALPAASWQPTDVDAGCFASIAAATAGHANVREPARADVLDDASCAWVERGAFDAVLVVNLLHISPVGATRGALALAARSLRGGGRLFVYGPFLVDGRPTTDSNAAFDADLRARNAEWGLRDVRDVVVVAAAQGLRIIERLDMPANNFLLVFDKER